MQCFILEPISFCVYVQTELACDARHISEEPYEKLYHKPNQMFFSVCVCVLQFGGPLDSGYPAVIVEQVPHAHLLSYSGLVCEQSQIEDVHQQPFKGQYTHTRTHTH